LPKALIEFAAFYRASATMSSSFPTSPLHFQVFVASVHEYRNLECKDVRPDNHIVLTFTGGESADTPAKLTVNLDVPEAELESAVYTVRPGDQNFDVKLPVRASDFRAHSKLDFSVELEDDQSLYDRI
jgi:hypothetical protein